MTLWASVFSKPTHLSIRDVFSFQTIVAAEALMKPDEPCIISHWKRNILFLEPQADSSTGLKLNCTHLFYYFTHVVCNVRRRCIQSTIFYNDVTGNLNFTRPSKKKQKNPDVIIDYLFTSRYCFKINGVYWQVFAHCFPVTRKEVWCRCKIFCVTEGGRTCHK